MKVELSVLRSVWRRGVTAGEAQLTRRAWEAKLMRLSGRRDRKAKFGRQALEGECGRQRRRESEDKRATGA